MKKGGLKTQKFHCYYVIVGDVGVFDMHKLNFLQSIVPTEGQRH